MFDVHAHVIVPDMLRTRVETQRWRPSVRWEGGVQIVELGGKTIHSATREFVEVERILEEASSLGVDRILLSPWVNLLPDDLDATEALQVCRLQNSGLSAATQKDPSRLFALGTVPLSDPALAARELVPLMQLPGIRGVEVSASVGGVYPGDDKFLPFWEAAEACNALVFIHPTTRGIGLPVLREYYLWNTVGNPMETTVAAAHIVAGGILLRYPRLKILLAHGGGALTSLRGRLRHAAGFQPEARLRLARIHGDHAPDALEERVDHMLRSFYYDTVTHDPRVLQGVIDFAGIDHVLAGSDYPFDMGSYPAADDVRKLHLSPGDEEAVLSRNAERLLGIGPTVPPDAAEAAEDG